MRSGKANCIRNKCHVTKCSCFNYFGTSVSFTEHRIVFDFFSASQFAERLRNADCHNTKLRIPASLVTLHRFR